MEAETSTFDGPTQNLLAEVCCPQRGPGFLVTSTVTQLYSKWSSRPAFVSVDRRDTVSVMGYLSRCIQKWQRKKRTLGKGCQRKSSLCVLKSPFLPLRTKKMGLFRRCASRCISPRTQAHVSTLYLKNIYQLLADPDATCRCTPSPLAVAKLLSLSPSRYTTWVIPL